MNKEISQIFGGIIKLLEIKGDKALSFKIKAYKKAIYILDNFAILLLWVSVFFAYP